MDQITQIPLEHLRESPTNPRKAFPEGPLQELANSLAYQGFIEPIIVRPAPNRPGDSANLIVSHEIVVGHRRFRAAQMAGLDAADCIVRDLTDQQVSLMQIHENLHRSDVSAIEEADGFAAMMEQHGVSADALAASCNKSRSYVYARVRLAKAAPEVRDAVATQGLGSEIAQRVARLPGHKLQAKALQELRKEAWIDGAMRPDGWISDREAKRRMRDFTIPLAQAPFSLDDAKLAARAGACTICPQRAGNDPELAAELDADTCLDPACYESKVKAHHQLAVAAARKAGHRLIEGDDALKLLPHKAWRCPDDHMLLQTEIFEEPDPEHEDQLRSVTLAEGLQRLGKKAPKPIVVVSPHTGEPISCLPEAQVDDLMVALAKAGKGPAAQAQEDPKEGPWPFGEKHVDESLSPEERAVVDRWDLVAESIMDAACERKDRTADEMLLIARALIADCYDIDPTVVAKMGWADEMDAAAESGDFEGEEAWCLKRLSRAEPWEVAQFAVLISIGRVPVVHGQEGRAEKLALAAAYGVDPVAVAKRDDEEQTDDAGSAGGSDAQAEAPVDDEVPA